MFAHRCIFWGHSNGKGVNHGEISTEDHDIWSELLRKIILCQKSSIHPEEVGRFFAKIKDRRDRAMFKLMYDFGLRASEVGKLILKGLDLERRVPNIEGIYIP